MHHPPSPEPEGAGKPRDRAYDVFRDGPARYLGYANEVGEAFRPLAPRLVTPSYAVAFAYVLADTVDKGRIVYNKDPDNPDFNRQAATLAVCTDVLTWQTFASVAIPGFTINQVVKYSKRAISKATVSPVLRAWGPTAIGLGVIPIIIRPIDALVDVAMDATIRPMLKFLVSQSGT